MEDLRNVLNYRRNTLAYGFMYNGYADVLPRALQSPFLELWGYRLPVLLSRFVIYNSKWPGFIGDVKKCADTRGFYCFERSNFKGHEIR